jgi:hypothetical protein
VDRVSNVDANQFITIEEGAGIAKRQI